MFSLQSTSNAATFTVGNSGASVTASNLMSGTLNYAAAGTVNANGGITGNIDFAGNNGVLQLADGQTITGNVDSSSSSAGTLEFLGAGTVTGNIGSTNPLSAINFNGSGAINLQSTSNAATFTVGNSGASVTASNLMSGTLNYAAAGTVNANGGITGNIDFAGNNGVLQLADGQTITGNVDSSSSSAGTLEFLGAGTVSGTIGSSNALTMLRFSGTGTDYIPEAANVITIDVANAGAIITASSMLTSNVLFSSNGSLIANGGITGNVDFAGNNGVLQLADGQTITGNVDSSSSSAGTLEFLGSSTINGVISNISTMLAGAGNITFSTFGNYSIGELKGNGSGTITFPSGVNFTGGINTSGGEPINLSFAGNTNITGNVGSISSPVGNISIPNGSNVIFSGDVNSSSININNANIGIVDNIEVQSNISASNSNILLGNNTLKLSGSHRFSDQITISSTYDESSLSGGNIILQSGSTLDLSNVSQLIIRLAFINSDISNITDDTQYNIILAEDGSNIVLLNDPKNQVILDSSGEQNRFVKWTLDASSLTLYAYDDSGNIIDNDYVFNSVQNNTFMQELKNTSPDSLAQEFKNNIGLLDKQQMEDMFPRILDYPKEHSSDIVRVALHQVLTDTNRASMNVIHGRLLNTNPIVASGDEDVSKYGLCSEG